MPRRFQELIRVRILDLSHLSSNQDCTWGTLLGAGMMDITPVARKRPCCVCQRWFCPDDLPDFRWDAETRVGRQLLGIESAHTEHLDGLKLGEELYAYAHCSLVAREGPH